MLTKDNVTIGIKWRFGPDWPGQRCGAKTRRGTACQRPANKIKTLTGSDTVATRALYQDMIEFRNKATIWVACNHKPEVDAADAAMWRRIRLIPFKRVFQPSEQDPELAAKLLSESDGILTWIMQGLAMYRAQGLAEPDSVVKATTHYRNEMDSVLRFIEENAKLDPTTRETIGEIKDRYRDCVCINNYINLRCSQTVT